MKKIIFVFIALIITSFTQTVLSLSFVVYEDKNSGNDTLCYLAGYSETAEADMERDAICNTKPVAAPMWELGKPSLPVYRFCLAIPQKSDVTLIVNFDNERIILLDQEILPSQPLPSTTGEGQLATPVRDEKLYASDNPYPEERARIVNRGFIRDLEVLTIEVAPMQYLPKSKALIIAEGLKVVLNCEGGGSFTATGLEANQIPIYKTLISNFGEIETKIKPLASKDVLPTVPGANILIIAYDSFIPSLATLVNWRISQGYDVEVVGISTIYMPEDDTEDEKISRLKSYLTTIMDPATGWNPRPGFVLLVGDKAQITPAYFTGTYGDLGYSDYHYSCVVGTDWYCDLAIGRFSASNTTDVINQVNKTLFYEQNPQAHTGVGGASGEIDGDFENCEDCKISLLMETGGLFCQTNYNGLDGSNSNTFIHAFNGTVDPATGKDFAPGTGIITVDTHGNSGVWGGLLSISSVNNATMTNRHYFPIALISACLCGKFDDEDCIMEKLQTIQGGTIANSGSAVLACGGTSDQLLNIALQGIMGIRPPYHPDRFEYTISPDIGYVPILGQAMAIAKNQYLTYFGNPNGWNVKECMMQYNLFGDPALMTNFNSDNRISEMYLDNTAVSLEWLPIFPKYTVQYCDIIDGIWQDVPGTTWPIKENTWNGDNVSGAIKRFYCVIGNSAE